MREGLPFLFWREAVWLYHIFYFVYSVYYIMLVIVCYDTVVEVIDDLWWYLMPLLIRSVYRCSTRWTLFDVVPVGEYVLDDVDVRWTCLRWCANSVRRFSFIADDGAVVLSILLLLPSITLMRADALFCYYTVYANVWRKIYEKYVTLEIWPVLLYIRHYEVFDDYSCCYLRKFGIITYSLSESYAASILICSDSVLLLFWRELLLMILSIHSTPSDIVTMLMIWQLWYYSDIKLWYDEVLFCL